MKINVSQITKLKLLALLLLLVLPWTINNEPNLNPEPITSDLAFYEINTCKISLANFLVENLNVIYQDHYKIRHNNYSSINCYGTITGIDQINDVFYISIGTNMYINIIIQSLIILILISLISKKRIREDSYLNYLSTIFSSIIFCMGIFSEKRFYSKNLYFFDFEKGSNYISFFLIFITISYFSIYLFNTRGSSLLNYFPFIYLVVGLFSGFNIYFYSIFFVNIGFLYFLISGYKNLKINITYLFLILFWANKTKDYDYYLDPDKVRGLLNTSTYDISLIYWSVLIYFIIQGLYYLVKVSMENFNFKLFESSYYITGLSIFTLGYFGAHLPLINFTNYIYFGQQKFGTDAKNLFSRNEWSELVAWRGFASSAESIGEFYGLGLLMFFIYHYKYAFKDIEVKRHWPIPFLLVGLLSSNNKSAILLLVFMGIFFMYKNKKNYKLLTIGAIIFIVIASFLIIGNSFEYSSSKLLASAVTYSYESNYSSATNFVLNNENIFLESLFGFISIVSFFINRSILWGMFLARYNPSLSEFLIGSGPYGFAKLYGEIQLSETNDNILYDKSFLLPHSSLLSLIMFVGIIFTSILIFFAIKNLVGLWKSENWILFSFLFFSLVNMIKSDSILYFSSLSMYLIIFFLSVEVNKKNKEFSGSNIYRFFYK